MILKLCQNKDDTLNKVCFVITATFLKMNI